MRKTLEGNFMLPAANGSLTRTEGIFTMPKTYAAAGYLKDAEEVFAERLARLGGYICTDDGTIFAFVDTDAFLAEEGYILQITTDQVKMTVAGAAGYRRALETLFVLLASGNGSVPCMEIHDQPRFAKRSVMLDTCRHFFSVEAIKRIIEQMSIVHMNMFHWHLSDDQGYRIESRQFPLLNERGSWRKLAVMDPVVTEYGAKPGDTYGGFYTEDEIREVVEYAARRGVDVVPEIDLPGHASAILSVYPELTCSGKEISVQNTFGVHRRIFCAGKEETFSFLFRLIDEIAAMFPSKYFHIGGDEAPKMEWKSCSHCRARMEKLGLTSYEQLQCYFTQRLVQHLKEIGKIPISWNESAISGDLAPETVIQYWAEMGDGESYCAREIPKGRMFMLSNCDQFYCTDSYAAMSLGCTLMYEPNVKGIPVPDKNVFGVEMPMWSEWTPTPAESEPQMFPRMLAVAECGWKKEKSEEDLMERAEAFVQNSALSVMKALKWDEVSISGEAALKEIAVSLVTMGKRYSVMAEAEQLAGGEAGVVAAVKPDDEAERKPEEVPADPRAMIRAYVAGKMTNGFMEEDIDRVTDMVLAMMAGM